MPIVVSVVLFCRLRGCGPRVHRFHDKPTVVPPTAGMKVPAEGEKLALAPGEATTEAPQCSLPRKIIYNAQVELVVESVPALPTHWHSWSRRMAATFPRPTS